MGKFISINLLYFFHIVTALFGFVNKSSYFVRRFLRSSARLKIAPLNITSINPNTNARTASPVSYPWIIGMLNATSVEGYNNSFSDDNIFILLSPVKVSLALPFQELLDLLFLYSVIFWTVFQP